ncbi:MAG: leucine-rich repeat protein [Clostridia bacterium]|nr:leucine-rich repeat protein [Clostridia bacterium]
MKTLYGKVLWAVLVLVIAVFAAAGASASTLCDAVTLPAGEGSAGPRTVSAQLPDSLLLIEDSAFEGTALVTVRLPEGLVSLGDRVFADIPTLERVAMPDSLTRIGRDVLAGSDRAAVLASAGSRAGDWARENGIRFTPIVLMTAGTASQQGGQLTLTRTPGVTAQEAQMDDAPGARRPGRSSGEIKAAACTGRLAMNVRGRYFP